MTSETLPYFFFLFLAPIISLGVGIYAWKQRATPGRQTFAIMMFAIAWWGFFYTLQLLAGSNLEQQIFWNSIRQIGANIVAPHFLLFVLHYTSNEKRITRGLYLFLGIPTVLMILLGLTNPLHHLYWDNFVLTQSGPLMVLDFDRGITNVAFIVFSYLQILSGIIYLFAWLYSNSQRLYRLQVVVLVLSVLAPWISNFWFSFGLTKIDPTSFAFMFTGIGFAWAIFRFRLLDLAPVARELIIENHEDAVFVFNVQNQIVDLNQTARAWLHMSDPAAIIGQPAAQVFHAWTPILTSLEKTGKDQSEFTTGKDENSKVFEIRMSPLSGTNNRQIGRLLILRDITARRQLDLTLREAQLKYQSLAEHIPAATYIDNPDELGTANYLSPQIETMLGYPLAEWQRDPQFWHKVVFPEDYPEASKIIQKTLAEGRAAAEYRMIAQDGRIVWVQDESVLIRDEAGRPLWVQGILIDITARKQSEQSLKELQLRYQNLAERIPATIYIDTLDESGVNDYMSPKIETILGYPPETWKEDPHFWHKVIHPEDYSIAVSSVQNTLEKGSSNVEYRMIDKNGRPIWIQDESVLIRDEKGEPLWIQGVLFDISRRKKAETTQQAFLDDMKALQEIHLNLSVIEDLDNLYIQMVSQAQVRLGFDRLGLFALNHANNQLMGTFGVGTGGEIRDERYYHEPITEDHWTLEIFNAPKRTKLWENAPLYDDAQIVGYGWKAATTLWNGRQAVGYMVCDNYISRKPARPYETELLAILGSIYGHLIERKQTDALLQASEARFRQIIENASDIIYRTDANGNFVYANPTALRIMGYASEQEVLGKNFLELCIPEQRDRLRSTYFRQFASKTMNTYHEFAALTPDQRTVWLGQNVQLIFENNQLTGFQAVARDITLRKEAEAQAAERAAQLSALNQLGRDIVASLDIPHVCAATHKAIDTLMPMEAFYIAVYDAENQEIEDVYLYDEGQIWPNARGPLTSHGLAGKVILSGHPLLIEDDYTPDVSLEDKILFGSPRDTRSVMVVPLIAEGQILGAISAQHYSPNVYNSSHLELLELLGNQVAIALKNAQQVQALQLQAAMLDAAANAIAIIDLTGIIQWVNPAFTQLTGYTAEEAVGKTTRILRSGMHPPEFYQPLYTAIMAGKTWQGELINRKKDGTLYHESQTITPVFDKEGKLFRFITIKQDLTELIVARDRALEASRLKSQLLSRVSHELRTPLGGILGYAELLQHELFGPMNERQKQTTGQIIDSTNYLNTMVNELLDEAQLAAGNLIMRNAPFSPKQVMKKVEGFLSVIARQKGLVLKTSVSDELVELWGDEQRLQQILTNLIGNAIKFTKTGEVRAEIYPATPMEWGIKVSDTGSGIPPEAREMIFEPFRQVDNAITRENRGTGLGLSITKQLVEFMGGRIYLESQIGQGSTFTILLPHKKESEKIA